MKNILHHLKKDIAHQRWALLAWAALLLVHLLVSGFQILRHVPNPQASTGQFADMVASWVVFLPLLFVVLAVQADPPVGTSAFWLTRPLRGGQMLVAKALYLLLFFAAIPLAVEIAVLLLRGAGAMAWLALPEFSVLRLPVVLGAFALGAATGRFLHALTLAACGAGFASLAALVGQFLFWRGADGAPPAGAGSAGIVALWVLAATFVAVATVQFVTRRSAAGRALLAVGIGVAMLVLVVWPWNLRERPLLSGDGPSGEIGLRIATANLSWESLQNVPRSGIPMRQISVPIAIEGGSAVAASQFLAPVSSRLELVTASSQLFTGSASYAVSPAQPNYRAALGATLSAQGCELLSPGDAGSAGNFPQPLSHTFAMDDARYAQVQDGLRELRAAVDLGGFGFEPAGALPLRDGALWQDRGDEVEIVRIDVQGDVLQFKIREQQLSMIFAARNAYGRQNCYPWVLVLTNPATRQAILLQRDDSPMAYQGAAWISPFLRRDALIEVHLARWLRGDSTRGDAQRWLENATLTIVRKRNLGSVRVHETVEINHLQQNHPIQP